MLFGSGSLNVKSETVFIYIYIYILMFSVHVVIKFQGEREICQEGISRGPPLCMKPCPVKTPKMRFCVFASFSGL